MLEAREGEAVQLRYQFPMGRVIGCRDIDHNWKRYSGLACTFCFHRNSRRKESREGGAAPKNRPHVRHMTAIGSRKGAWRSAGTQDDTRHRPHSRGPGISAPCPRLARGARRCLCEHQTGRRHGVWSIALNDFRRIRAKDCHAAHCRIPARESSTQD